jgi:hypothetical protein
MVLSALETAVTSVKQLHFHTLGITLALLYVANAIRVWYRLRHFAGPLSAGWSKWWLIHAHTTGRTHLDLAEVCEKYGVQYMKPDPFILIL